MKFPLSVTLSALALASHTLAADLEDRSYYGGQQQQQQQAQDVSISVSTTTATQYVTVTLGAEQAVCTTSSTDSVDATSLSAPGYQAPVFVTTSVPPPPPQQTTSSTNSVDAQQQQQQQYTTSQTNTNTLAAQDQSPPPPSYETETLTSTRSYTTTELYAAPTTITQLDNQSVVVHTVDVTMTSTRLVRETEVVTRTKTKTEVVRETDAAHHQGSGHGHNSSSDHGHHDTSTSTSTSTSNNAAATVADVNTSTSNSGNGGVVTITDFETSTFLVTTTIDGALATETGTTTLETTTTSTSGGATIADANTSTDSTDTSTSTSTSDASAATSTSADAANNTNDPQSSLTLDPRVIETGFEQDGQSPPVAGQVPSLTSKNNFINFCLTQSDVPLTDGKQIRTGSCNPVPQGLIIAKDKIPSAKFVFPLNFSKIPANQAFTAKLKINNLQAGAFTNAQSNYYAAPAQVNSSGVLIGHSHLVIEQLNALDDTEPLDPTKFAFFKGLNNPLDADGTLSATLTAGLPAGVYRMFSINTAANHQPALASVAQHGSMDDGVYFTAE